MDFEELLQYWENELRGRRGADSKLYAAVRVASCLSMLGRDREAFERLEELGPEKPPLGLLVDWLNLRAYLLVMLERADEALPLVEEAALVVDDSTAEGLSVAGHVLGTRGIALLHLGRLEEAEACLMRAFEIGRQAVEAEGRPEGRVGWREQYVAAERWYWLAEIASRRGDPEEARRRLERAAAGEGPFAARAAARLA